MNIENMELELVTFEQAKALKELGFPQCECWRGYLECGNGGGVLMDKDSYSYSAPELELVAKWLREVKDIFLQIDFEYIGSFYCNIYIIHNDSYDILNPIVACKSYEEALSRGIDKALELLKNNK